MAHAPKFLKLVNEAKARVKETNVADVKRRMDGGEKLTLVDVREDNEWAQGHVPGAVHLGRGIIERDIEARVPDTGAKLVLYCGGGFRSGVSGGKSAKDGLHECGIDGRRMERLGFGGIAHRERLVRSRSYSYGKSLSEHSQEFGRCDS